MKTEALPPLSPKARLVLAWLEPYGVVRLVEWIARIPASLRRELYAHGCCRLVHARAYGVGEAIVEVVETEYSYLIPPQRLQLAALARVR